MTERKLNLARKRYLPVAVRGSVLYFVIADLTSVDVMYQFSLEWFQNMFITCITAADDDSDARCGFRVGSRVAAAALREGTARKLAPHGYDLARTWSGPEGRRPHLESADPEGTLDLPAELPPCCELDAASAVDRGGVRRKSSNCLDLRCSLSTLVLVFVAAFRSQEQMSTRSSDSGSAPNLTIPSPSPSCKWVKRSVNERDVSVDTEGISCCWCRRVGRSHCGRCRRTGVRGCTFLLFCWTQIPRRK